MSAHESITIERRDGLGRAEMQRLGTGVVVMTTDPGRIAAAGCEVSDELADIDAACSRFRHDSELEVANRSAGRPVTVSPLLAEAIAAALRAAAATGGAVDPTVGGAMHLNGYDRDFDALRPTSAPTQELPEECAPAGAWPHIRFAQRWGLLTVPVGVSLDLGATAKALAADRAAQRVHERLGCGALVSLGGDIAVAGPFPFQGWNIRVTDWHGSGVDTTGQTVRIDSGGLATSSTTVRRWIRGDREMHHIVDPTTGRPAQEVWRTVSVCAGTCVDSNTAATASIVKGEAAVAWLDGLGLAARLVRPNGQVTVAGDWPEKRSAA